MAVITASNPRPLQCLTHNIADAENNMLSSAQNQIPTLSQSIRRLCYFHYTPSFLSPIIAELNQSQHHDLLLIENKYTRKRAKQVEISFLVVAHTKGNRLKLNKMAKLNFCFSLRQIAKKEGVAIYIWDAWEEE